MAKQIKVKKKNVQKGFFEVETPLVSTNVSLYAGSIEDLDGRHIKLDMSKNLRGKNLELDMAISVKDGKAEASPVKAKLVNSYLKRVVRKGTDYAEDSFVAKCKDGEIIVKPFLITRRRVSRAVRRELRNSARDFLTAYVTPKTYIELFTDVLGGKVQKEMASRLKKIYPLSLSEIRVLEVKREKKKEE